MDRLEKVLRHLWTILQVEWRQVNWNHQYFGLVCLQAGPGAALLKLDAELTVYHGFKDSNKLIS